jgi:hypothetical protein
MLGTEQIAQRLRTKIVMQINNLHVEPTPWTWAMTPQASIGAVVEFSIGAGIGFAGD